MSKPGLWRGALAVALLGATALALPGRSEPRSGGAAAPADQPERVRRQIARIDRTGPDARRLSRARCDGKYAMLLAQISVPDDAETYTEFRDWGPWSGSSYSGFENLPPGHWVYVAPYWYIWRDLVSDSRPEPRSWGTEQVIGAPDTPTAGDHSTAWASKTPDGQDEWLLVEFATPAVPKSIVVHETYNPGALARITGFRLDGTEVTLWEGIDPTPATRDRGESVIPVNIEYPVGRIKLHLKSTEVAGWNEIDAVGLILADGQRAWASAAHASSCFADPEQDPPIAPPLPDVIPDAERIRLLEARVEKLEAEIARLRRAIPPMIRRLGEPAPKLTPPPM